MRRPLQRAGSALASALGSVRVPRTRLVALALIAAAALVSLRLVELTVLAHDDLEAIARSQSEDVVEIPGPRGEIVDRNGRPLATSIPVHVLAIEPRKISPAGLRALEVAADVPGRLAHRGAQRWFPVRRDCDDAMRAAVDDLVTRKIVPRDAIHWGLGFVRRYPNGPVAAHVLGFVSIDESLAEGVEKSYDRLLRSGESRVLRSTDAHGTALASLAGNPYPAASSSLMLTIDLRIQEVLEQALAAARKEHGAKSAQGIVIDPKSGEVLAMANSPGYDPNLYNTYRKEERGLFRNTVIEFPFEPGSVMKPLTAAGLAEYDKVNDFETVWCENGHWKRGRWTLSDTHPHGALTVAEVISKSSNIGIVKLSQRLTPEQLHGILSGLGLGRRTGIDLPAENGGKLGSWNQWRPIDKDCVAFGHSVMVTLLQLAQAYGAIGNGGVLVPPRVARAFGEPDGEWHTVSMPEPRRAISAKAAARVALWSLGVVESKGGTGRRAAVFGFRVAGKTGTAEKIKNGRYERGKNIGTFAGFAPVSDPRVVVVISLDEPSVGARTGGIVAAPTFSTVMSEALRLLRVAPDYLPEAPEPVAQRAAAQTGTGAQTAGTPTPAPGPAARSTDRKGKRG